MAEAGLKTRFFHTQDVQKIAGDWGFAPDPIKGGEGLTALPTPGHLAGYKWEGKREETIRRGLEK